MKEQVTSLCRSSCFHLRKIASIRPFLSYESTAQLVSSLILSRLDCCSSILSGLPSSSLSKYVGVLHPFNRCGDIRATSSLNQLQKVQNNAARLVLRKRKSDSVTPLLEKLHWLPAEARIHYKIATVAFGNFENSFPQYLSELLHIYQRSQTLRSSREKLLKAPKLTLNLLETDLSSFKQLKSRNSPSQLSTTLRLGL